MITHLRIRTAILCALGTLTLAPAQAVTFDYALRARGAFEADGPRDLGTNGGGRNDDFFLDLSPRLLVEFNPSFSGYLRARAFLPTGRVAPFDDGQPTVQNPGKSFVGLDEFWLEYNGLTNYPGETVRIGRQLIREDDTEWLGQNIDALRWVFDTTLLRADAGVGHQFSAYRTDGSSVTPEQRDRTYGFGAVSTDWRPEHSLGLRALHASDGRSPPDVGTVASNDRKLEDSQLTWIGLFAQHGAFETRNQHKFAYWADANYLTGRDREAVLAPGRVVADQTSQHISAFSGSVGLRWQPFQTPVKFGAAYTYSEGGGSGQYRQSGLQGNATTYTGTSTFIYRYNDTLRAELGNLRVATAFVSLNLAENDASLIFENFSKDDRSAPITTGNITAATNTTSRDVGNGLDLVLSHYFRTHAIQPRLVSEAERFIADSRSSIRLRASVFDPGSAYGPNAKTDYRILLEGTLWVY